MNRKAGHCYTCTLSEKCAYAYIFETSPAKSSEKLKNLREIPRPFVIEPPPETKMVYNQGETLQFNLILIGKAIDYLPYFIFTFTAPDVGFILFSLWPGIRSRLQGINPCGRKNKKQKTPI
ncbi:hypothetical protein M1N63_02925 [Thermodesulfovibrionales bacterium]|nr:hypothetical protein [Thermodesulfovibrionales bacterium]